MLLFWKVGHVVPTNSKPNALKIHSIFKTFFCRFIFMAQSSWKLFSCHRLPGAASTAVLIREKKRTTLITTLFTCWLALGGRCRQHVFTELCILRLLNETAQKNVTTQECWSFCLWAKVQSILRACLPWKCPGCRCGCCPCEGRRTGITDAGWSSSPTQTDPPEHTHRPSFKMSWEFWL